MSDGSNRGKESRPWFGSKRYGFGLRPQTWQGWAITAALVVVVIAVTRLAQR